MRRISILTILAMVAGLIAVALRALTAAADTNVTLDATTCGIQTDDVSIAGTWSGSTCTANAPDVQFGSSLTIPAGT